MTRITPNREQFEQLARAPDEGPVVMLNLLEFKATATDGSGSGADAYQRYGKAAVEMVTKPAYTDAHEHCEQGLERTVVVACSPRLDRLGGS